MTISLVTGLPGFGKTLKLTEFGYKANLAGKHVYSNFRMQNLPNSHLYTHYNDPLEVLGSAKNALILMSEVGILLDQFKMWQIPLEVWENLRQHRKDGVNIIADAQNMGDVDYRFRKLVQFQYHIYSKYKLFGVTFQLARVFNPQPKGEDFGRRYWIMNPKYWHYYDTNYKLEKNESAFDIAQRVIQSPLSDYQKMRYLNFVKSTEAKELIEIERIYFQENQEY